MGGIVGRAVIAALGHGFLLPHAQTTRLAKQWLTFRHHAPTANLFVEGSVRAATNLAAFALCLLME